MSTPRGTNFPGGFSNGLTVRGQNTMIATPAMTYWVDSNSIRVSRKGTFDQPFASLAALIAATGPLIAGRGDTVMLKAGHIEPNITTAGGISIVTATVGQPGHNNLRIIGLGQGDARPKFTFSGVVGASILITAPGVTIENIVGITGLNALTQPFDVRAVGVSLDIEWQDPTDVLEAVRAVLTTAAADKLRLAVKYIGRTGGSSCVNAIRLVGCDDARVDIDFYGKASTAVVEFVTTACTSIAIRGDIYNNGGGSAKNVIDTVTGSTWWADFMDGVSGQRVIGGSAAGAAIGISTPTRRLASKVIANAAASLTTGASPVALFTVVGDVVARVFATIQTAITSTGANGTLAIGVTGNTGSFIAATTADGTNFPTGAVWAGDTSPTLKSEVFTGTSLNHAPIAGSAGIICTVATNSMIAGAITFYCEWFPCSTGASVIGA